jgi:hypothetical protein
LAKKWRQHEARLKTRPTSNIARSKVAAALPISISSGACRGAQQWHKTCASVALQWLLFVGDKDRPLQRGFY